MGLFDGISADGLTGSTAEVARLLGAPILLLADAEGQGQSFAATLSGFFRFERSVPIAAVVANHVGSSQHLAVLTEAVATRSLPPLVGGLTKGSLPHLGSQHLGLVPPAGMSSLDALADAVEANLSLDSVLRIARPLSAEGRAVGDCLELDVPLRLAVAEDAAFGFVYADFRERLQRLGVEWISCSPLRDREIPAGARALFLPGGYPEKYAAALSDNAPFLGSVRKLAQSRPIYAECGGLMYLGDSLQDLQGTTHRMAGVLPCSSRMRERVCRLGYVQVTLASETLWGGVGDRCRGHEFHYSELASEATADHGWERAYRVESRRGASRLEGFTNRNTLASYVHLHFASRPWQLLRFLHNLAA